ncbi:MAG: ABC transporter ATP-binding protein [Ottowia sp.]|uniref:ABC transporter ATP-binding protein n=1 Tax=Ottowia sp. TaxID=1898956 RepID=UPI003C754BA7
MNSPLVHVRDLHVRFQSTQGSISAVNGVNLDLNAGETLCILGESGSGKSVTLRSLMRLNPEDKTQMQGTLHVAGMDIIRATRPEMSALRGSTVSMIFQEPMTSLDPVFTIGTQIAETVRRHDGCSADQARQRALDLLELVQVPSARQRLEAYPHELSGGLRQRAMIAIALSCRPQLLLADEPTTALDATVQIQVLLLLKQLQKELGMGIIFVTHDLGVACEVANRIAVMYAGRIIEDGATADILRSPSHPYTRGLLNATVHANMRGQRLSTIPGSPPSLTQLPAGCSFAPRCEMRTDHCAEALPPLRPFGNHRAVRCHLAALQP